MAVFAVMACLVTIFGAKDIRKMLRALGEEGGPPEESEDEEP